MKAISAFFNAYEILFVISDELAEFVYSFGYGFKSLFPEILAREVDIGNFRRVLNVGYARCVQELFVFCNE